MADPTTTSAGGISLTTLFVALFGPLAGPYALIVFAALAGALWPLSSTETETRAAGAWLLLRCTLTAIALTAFIGQGIDKLYGIPAVEALSPVAFAIGALGNGWRPVFVALASAVAALASRLGGARNES